jgi:exosortase
MADGPAWVGLAPLLAGVLLRLLGAFWYFSWLEMISLLPILWGAALLLGGWPAFRWSWGAVGFLAFMLPLPFSLERALSAPLQQGATWLSTYTLQTLGCPAFREGNVIVLNAHRIGVVEACNGLGMLILFFALSSGVALLIDRPWVDRVVLVASAAPIAVLANATRIVATSLLYQVAGQRWGDFLFHDLAGWLMMPLALGMLGLELKLMSWLLIVAPPEEEIPLAFSPTVKSDLQHAPAPLPDRSSCSAAFSEGLSSAKAGATSSFTT